MAIHLLDVFISEKERKKLLILEYLHQETRVAPEYLMEKLALNQKTLNRLVNELTSNLQIDLQLKQVKIHYSGHFYEFSYQMKDQEFLQLHNALKSAYVKSSHSYTLFEFLLKKRKTNSVEVARHLSLSQSYVYKVFKKLEKFTEKSEFDLQIKKENGDWYLLGSEKEIRFIRYFLILNIQSSEIVNVYLSKYKSSWSKLYLKQNKILSSICNDAINQNFFMQELSEESCQIYEVLKDWVQLSSFIEVRNEAVKENENHYFLFLTLFQKPEAIPRNEKVKASEELQRLANQNLLIQSSLRLANVLMEMFGLSAEVRNLLVYEIALRHIVFFELNYWKLLDFEYRLNSYVPKQLLLEDVVRENMQSYGYLKGIDHFIHNISEICYSYGMMESIKPIKIYAFLHRKSSKKVILKNLIQTIYKDQAIFLSDTLEDADILVTDMVLKTTKEIDVFYFSDINNRQDWYRFCDFLQKKLLEKLINFY